MKRASDAYENTSFLSDDSFYVPSSKRQKNHEDITFAPLPSLSSILNGPTPQYLQGIGNASPYSQRPAYDPFLKPQFSQQQPIFPIENQVYPYQGLNTPFPQQQFIAQYPPNEFSQPYANTARDNLLTQHAPVHQPVVLNEPQVSRRASHNEAVIIQDSPAIVEIVERVRPASPSSQLLLPVKDLAQQTGLCSDAKSNWRYRDLKRSLFEGLSSDQFDFIENNSEHSVLKRRLPHKLSLVAFVKRIMLLVYHFILRDGREPKFWRKSHVKQDYIEKVLQEADLNLYNHINRRAAVTIRSYIIQGTPIQAAVDKYNNEVLHQHTREQRIIL
jgi:hypothetical protein